MTTPSKDHIRREMRDKLKKIEPLARFEASISAGNALLASESWQNAKTVLLYAAMKTELDTMVLLEAGADKGKRICLPRMVEETDAEGNVRHRLETRMFVGAQFMKPGTFGILEPDWWQCPVVELDEVDLMIVPGLAFDAQGNRLGRGRGYYDRLLNHPSRRAEALGYFFSFQELDAVPHDENDERLDGAITEEGFRTFRTAFRG